MITQATRFAAILAIAGLAIVACSNPSTNAHPPPSVAPTAISGPLQGQALVRAFRRGGLILWMRHGTRDDHSGDVSDQQAAAHNCAQQSQLTQAGQAQAREVGAGIRALNLPIAAVHTARLCRTEATGRLLNVGQVTDDARLDEATTWTDRGGDAAYQKAVLSILSSTPLAGTDVVEVTSKLTIPHAQPPVLAQLGAGEVAVFRPNPNGSPQLLARIGHAAWPSLARQAGTGSTSPVPPTR